MNTMDRGIFIKQIPQERFEELNKRCIAFQQVLDRPEIPPPKLFDTMSEKCFKELLMVREISAELQKKKVEDMHKHIMERGIFIKQIPDDRFEVLIRRCEDFRYALDHPELPPVVIFDSMREELLNELALIRAVSADLQKKKEEDMLKLHAKKNSTE